jgi:hypothetical protein
MFITKFDPADRCGCFNNSHCSFLRIINLKNTMKKAEKVEKKKTNDMGARAYPAGSIVLHGGCAVPF